MCFIRHAESCEGWVQGGHRRARLDSTILDVGRVHGLLPSRRHKRVAYNLIDPTDNEFAGLAEIARPWPFFVVSPGEVRADVRAHRASAQFSRTRGKESSQTCGSRRARRGFGSTAVAAPVTSLFAVSVSLVEGANGRHSHAVDGLQKVQLLG